MPTVVREWARAKVNLDLLVLGRRADGYHALDSIVAFADVADILTFVPSQALSLVVEGPFAAALSPPIGTTHDNLVMRAAHLLEQRLGRSFGVTITLDKQLPVASGIGGGSADAAATLRGLNTLFDLGLASGDLASIGRELGADIPVCIESRPVRMSGIGEVLEPIPLAWPLPAVLANPAVELSTGPVFKALGAGPIDDSKPEPLTAFDLLPWLLRRRNDLQGPAMTLAPVIGRVLELMSEQPGCRLARMSGSGASAFALFASRADAEAAEATIRRQEPRWWVRATWMGTPPVSERPSP